MFNSLTTLVPKFTTQHGGRSNYKARHVANNNLSISLLDLSVPEKIMSIELVEKDNFVFFHKGTDWLSQWFPSVFKDDTSTYTCAEQYMMIKKAMLFKDDHAYEKIMGTTNPAMMKRYGRAIKNFDEKVWSEKVYSIIVNGNYLKFSQNPNLKSLLLGTENKVLAEASATDRIYGIGMNSSNRNVTDQSKWKGQNLLGRALMEVREMLRKTPST